MAKLPINTDTILILENAFESAEGQTEWIQNLNIIEQLIVGIIKLVNINHPSLRANFIIRRFPTFTIPFFGKNEYGIILKNLDFNVGSSNTSVSDSVSIDGKPIRVNLGQVEVFRKESSCEEPCSSTNGNFHKETNGTKSNNTNKAYCSHEIFQRFAGAFVKSFTEEVEGNEKMEKKGEEENVQIIGPHLLQSLHFHPEVDKIFKLNGGNLLVSEKKKTRVKVEVDEEKCLLTLELDGTEVTIRPGLFLHNGYPRLYSTFLERIPLYHPAILNFGEALLKGCFLFPTNFQTLWTVEFWPSESHILLSFHPKSVVGRLLKLFGSFCINPTHFWDILNSCFLIGGEVVNETMGKGMRPKQVPTDFFTSIFLEELEHFPEATQWEPKNLPLRFTSLVTSAVEALDKAFHPHFFTRKNILRQFWGKRQEYSESEVEDEEHANGILSTDTNSRVGSRHHSTPLDDQEELDFEHDDYGLHFDELSLDDVDERNGRKDLPLRKSIQGSTKDDVGGISEDSRRPSRSLSKYIGTTIMRRLSMFTGEGSKTLPPQRSKVNRSMTDITSDFEEFVNQQRRLESFQHKNQSCEDHQVIGLEDVFSSSLAFADTPFHERQGIENKGYESRESMYAKILEILHSIASTNYRSTRDLITHLDTCRKVMWSQSELIGAWNQVLLDIPRPKHICPHTFSPRQIQSLSLVIQTFSKVTASSHLNLTTTRPPAWEMSGDILRTVLQQMRTESRRGEKDSFKQKRKPRAFSFKALSKSFSEGSKPPTSTRLTSKLSFRSGSYDVCKHHRDIGGLDPETETVLALEDPETAATYRLLQWLWQLRNSEIGRLSHRAERYMESLYNSSLIHSHFLEEVKEQHLMESMAVRSAVAVSRIMSDEKYPAEVPLTTASKRGWVWADMVLSFVAWNEENGNVLKAQVPLLNSPEMGVRLRVIQTKTVESVKSGQLTLKRIQSSTEPDTEALTLAFHSESATPPGMNDFEEPLCPGPYTVPILIFSEAYYAQWEVLPGNIVTALVRLQKFTVLQHIATLLQSPHRKTALNEVRKLNKSLAFSAFQFDDNVMTKTFKRLASLRHTRRLLPNSWKEKTYSCDEVGCRGWTVEGRTSVSSLKGTHIHCTRL